MESDIKSFSEISHSLVRSRQAEGNVLVDFAPDIGTVLTKSKRIGVANPLVTVVCGPGSLHKSSKHHLDLRGIGFLSFVRLGQD
jgi:hypothetical protein